MQRFIAPLSLFAAGICISVGATPAFAQLGGSLGNVIAPQQRAVRTIDPAALRVDRAAEFEARVERAMDCILPFDFQGETLDQAAAQLSRASGLPIYLDPKGLTDAAVDSSAPVTFTAHALSLRAALEAMLEQFDLTWTVFGDRVTITSKEKADEILTTKVYPVSDLIGSPPNFGWLMNMLTSTIQPDSWDDNGGPGCICPCNVGELLVISQKRDVHDEIADLLVQIRRQTGTVPRARSGGSGTAIGTGQAVVFRDHPRSLPASSTFGQPAGSRAAATATYLSNPDGLRMVGSLYGGKCRVRPGHTDSQVQ